MIRAGLVGLFLASAVAMADPGAEELVHQQMAVEEAAAAVARARAEGARRREIAVLMASYREQAEALAALQPALDAGDDDAERRSALASLAEASAAGREAPDERAVLDAWLGPLPERLELLQGVLDAAGSVRSSNLALDMVQDVEGQAVAVMVAATQDAVVAEDDAQRARLRITTLQRAQGSEPGAGITAEVDVLALERLAATADAQAAAAWTTRARAAALRDDARQILAGTSEQP